MKFPQGWFLTETQLALSLRVLSSQPSTPLCAPPRTVQGNHLRKCHDHMRASEAGNGLHRGRPHQAISTLLCTKQHGDLCVYFSSLQQCPTPGRLHSRDICCHIPPLVNKGTEAGDAGGFLSTAEYGVRWSSTVVSLTIMTAPQKGQRCPLPHTPPQYPVFITRKRCLMSLPAECTKGTTTVNGIPVRLILLPGSSLKPYLSSLSLAKKTISQGSLNRKPLRKEKGGRWGGGAAGRERKKMGFTGAE